MASEEPSDQSSTETKNKKFEENMESVNTEDSVKEELINDNIVIVKKNSILLNGHYGFQKEKIESSENFDSPSVEDTEASKTNILFKQKTDSQKPFSQDSVDIELTSLASGILDNLLSKPDSDSDMFRGPNSMSNVDSSETTDAIDGSKPLNPNNSSDNEGTSDIVKTGEKIDNSNIADAIVSSETAEIIDTSNIADAINSSKTAEQNETLNIANATHSSKSTEKIDTSNIADTIVSSETAEIIDTSNNADTKDSSEAAEIIDNSNIADAIDSSKSTEKIGTSNIADTIDSSETAEIIETSNNADTMDSSEAAEIIDNSNIADAINSSKTAEQNETLNIANATHSSKSTEKIDTSNIADTIVSSETAEIIDTSNNADTKDSSEAAEIIDNSNIADAIDSSKSTEKIGTSNIADTIDSSETAEIIETSNNADTMDSSEAAEIIDNSNIADAIDSSKSTEKIDTSNIADTIDSSETVEIIFNTNITNADSSKSVQEIESSNIADAIDSSETDKRIDNSNIAGKNNNLNYTDALDGSETAEIMNTSNIADGTDSSKTTEIIDNTNITNATDSSKSVQEIESSNIADAIESLETAEKNDSSNIADATDSSKTTEIIDNTIITNATGSSKSVQEIESSNIADAIDSSETTEKNDSSNIADATDSSKTTEIIDNTNITNATGSSKSVQEIESSNIADAIDSSETTEKNDSSNIADATDSSKTTAGSHVFKTKESTWSSLDSSLKKENLTDSKNSQLPKKKSCSENAPNVTQPLYSSSSQDPHKSINTQFTGERRNEDNTSDPMLETSNEPVDMEEDNAEGSADKNVESLEKEEKTSKPPVILELYNDEKGMLCEIKTDNLNVLEVESLSKELCGTEFIVDLVPPEPMSTGDSTVRPNALAPVKSTQPGEINEKATNRDIFREKSNETLDSQSPPKKRKSMKPSKLRDEPTPKPKSRKSLLTTKMARTKLSMRLMLEDAVNKKLGGKRAKSLGKAKSPASSESSPITSKIKSSPFQKTTWDPELFSIPLLTHGWFRELVHRKNRCPIKREGDIYYFSPEPERKKYRSRNEIERVLPKDSVLQAHHFSFTKQLLGLGPDYERERNAAETPGKGQAVSLVIKRTKKPPSKTASTRTSPVQSPKPKRERKKSTKLASQEDTDKENVTKAESPEVVKRGRKKSLNSAGSTRNKITPMRQRSKAKQSDPETTPELPNDDLSGAQPDKFPKLKIKIGLPGKTPKRRSSVVLKENNTPVSEKKKTPKSAGKDKSLGKNEKKHGSASKRKHTPVHFDFEQKKNSDDDEKKRKIPAFEKKGRNEDFEKKRKSSEVKVKVEPEDSPRKVPPISLSITKSPQKTIVSIKKSVDGKRPEIRVEIKKSVKEEVQVKTEVDEEAVGERSFDPMKTRKRAGFTLSKEEADIISGGKRAKTSSSNPSLTPPGISCGEVARLSRVKVCLSPVFGLSSAKKRKATKTLEAEFDRLNQDLMTKRKRVDVKSEKKLTQADIRKKSKIEKRPSYRGRKSLDAEKRSIGGEKRWSKTEKKQRQKRSSEKKKENVMVNGAMKKQDSKKAKRSAPSISSPITFTPSLLCNASKSNPLYKPLVTLLSYMPVQDRLRMARVNKLFHLAAQHQSLWTHIRLKNTRVHDWQGLAAAFAKLKTETIDMKKMLTTSDAEEQTALWASLPPHLAKIESLRVLDLGRCVASVFEHMKSHLSRLEILNATLHKDQQVVLSHFSSMTNLTKLRLKGFEIRKTAQNLFNLSSLHYLRNLKHLALTAVGNLNEASLDTITKECYQLTSLELGSCASLEAPEVSAYIARLTSLEKLRLEIVPRTISISVVETVSKMPALYHLELINVDVMKNFDNSLALCTNLRSLIIIPTYMAQSADTNCYLLSAFSMLNKTLRLLSWGLTVELLQVTNLFTSAWKGSGQKPEGSCIPIKYPIPACYLSPEERKAPKDPGREVELYKISQLKQLLTGYMENTAVSIMTMTYSNTLRHTMMK